MAGPQMRPLDVPVAVDPVAVSSPEGPAHATPVMLDCRGLHRDLMSRALDHVGDLTGVVALDVVVLIDSVDFDVPRGRGHLVEYVPPVTEVARRVGADAAARLEDSRWQEIVESHRPREIYRVADLDGDLRLELLVARPDTA